MTKNILLTLSLVLSSFAFSKTCFVTGKTAADAQVAAQNEGWNLSDSSKFFSGQMSKTFIGSLDSTNLDEFGLVAIKRRSDIDEAHHLVISELFLHSPYIRELRDNLEKGEPFVIVLKSCTQEVVLNKTRRQMRFITERILEINPPFVYKEFVF